MLYTEVYEPYPSQPTGQNLSTVLSASEGKRLSLDLWITEPNIQGCLSFLRCEWKIEPLILCL